ncbi:hypothetical protein IEQ34_006164 [Dendrobium chrysotoxum]|uniref:Uncharacterized protein n=1 Tax=Dendrobium chrysotoxum TaxID=161865 RepID=A0AAV7HAY1_DENCH|nr:hypothetical protein IEQ34_006164 [Dendrobium chrysotoxum]
MRDFEPEGEVKGLGMVIEDGSTGFGAASFSLRDMVGCTELWTFFRRKKQVQTQYRTAHSPAKVPTEPMMANASHHLLVFDDGDGGGSVEIGGSAAEGGGGGAKLLVGAPQGLQMMPDPEQSDSESGKMPHLQVLSSGTQIPGRIFGRDKTMMEMLKRSAFQHITVKFSVINPQVRSPPATIDSNIVPSTGE